MQTTELFDQTTSQNAQASEPPKPKSAPKKKTAKKPTNPLVESIAKRREEIWGALIMLASALCLVALFSYSVEDEVIIENVSLWEGFSDVGHRAAQELRNPLGLFGAKLSSFLMRSILGYPTASLLMISAFWGYALFRRQGFSKAIYLTVYGVVFATILASLFGLTEFSFSESMSGAIGRFIATTLSTLIGGFGAWCLLSALMLLVVALFIDLDLQKTFDRIAYLTRDKASEIASGVTLKFKEWREARERALQEELAESEDEFDSSDAPAPEPAETARAEAPPKETAKSDRSQERKAEAAQTPSAPTPERHDAAPCASPSQDEPFAPRDLLSDIANDAKPESSPATPLPEETAPPIVVETKSLESKENGTSAPPAQPASAPTRYEPPPQTRPLSIEEAIDRELEKLLNGFERESENPTSQPTSVAPQPIAPLAPREERDEKNLAPSPERREKDEVLDALLAELTAPKAKSEPATEELVVTVKEGAREKEANLDERELEVETKERFTYQFPSVDLLIDPEPETDAVSIEELEENKRKLLDKLRIYKIEVVRVEATVGPRVTLFELELAPDVKVSRITSLADDLAMAMAARGIRIIAPIPGKNAVGVEIPNSKPRIVRIKTLLQSEKFKNFKGILPIAFGKTIANEIYIDDLARMPHLLVAGATGSGKSVGINAILTSLIYFCSPEKVKFLLIDPKRVELFPYQKLKRHFLVKFKDLDEQIITDTSKAVYALKSVEKEMDLRYERLAKAGVRNIKDFNAKFSDEALPYIVVVIDELADMMITAGRDVEEPIARLAQLARAVGIHLVVATQRPSVDVITGVIKANFPARVAYQVASKIDSRTILDAMGAEQLLGHGDMLYLPATEPKPIRIQNAFVSTEEVEAITEFIDAQKGYDLSLELPAPDLKLTSSRGEMDDEDDGDFERDKMFEEAARLVVRHQQGSVSLLQRRLKLGFGRAARIMDQLEQAGIVGKPDGSKPREVLVESEDALEALLRNLD
ncbi:MAG: DNA translocase FtsK 4TM domain-containing protein [Chloroherpetonaceae bacterium]|nr:DNA translocase FtsK 4TM domain-containing protein [Chloroherpetonaceae bacterium]MDW8437886.1 DNA translocase FtsK 4TM domain-containing protein [Chloroherpetonaceae bacterium]